MSHKIGQVIGELLQKVGIDHTDKQYADLLSIQSELPKEAFDLINGLMTEQAAKNNISIKNHFIHSAYNPLDNEIHNRMDMFEFTDDMKDAVKNEKSTGKKQKMFLDFANEILKNKESSKGKKDDATETYKKEIETLRAQLASKDNEFSGKLQEKDEYHKNYVLNSRIEGEFSKHPWSENYSADVRGDLSKISLNKYLQSNGAKLILDEQNNPKIVKADNPELEYFDSSNKKLIFTELVAKLMAENKFLRVSDNGTNTTHTSVATGSHQPTTKSKSVNTVLQSLRASQSDQGLV